MLLVILLLSTALIFTRFALISFFVFLLVLGIVWSGGKISWLQQTVWAYVFFFCFLTIFSAVGSIAGLKIISTWPLLFLAAAAWVSFFKRGTPPNKKGLVEDRSWLGLLASLIVCFYVSIPLFLHPSAETVLRYSAKTTDDISHIARVEAIRSFGGLLYQKQAETTQLIDPGTSSSPQGWHVNTAYFEYLIIKFTSSDSTTIRLLSFLIYKTLWLFIAVFLLYLLLTQLLKNYFGVVGLSSDFLSALGVAAVSSVFLVAVFGYGYQSFVASLALVCASLLVATNYLSVTDKGQRRLQLFILALLTVASIYVWTLAGAIVGLLALAVLIKDVPARYKKTASVWQWVLGALVVVLASLPVYALLRSGSDRGLNTLNIGGATPPINVISVAIFFVITLVFIKKLNPKKKSWLILLMILTALEFLVVAIYQQITIGEQRYYAVKLAFLVAIITSAFFLAASLVYLTGSKLSKSSAALTYIAVLAILPLALGLDLRRSAYPLKDSAPIKTATAKSILGLPSSPDNLTTVFYTNNKEETFLANKLWSSVNLYNSKDRKALLEKMQQEIN